MTDRLVPNKAWFNGEVIPTEQVRISPFDRGFLYGDGVYELVRVFGGTPIAMDAHERRLAASLHATRINGFAASSYTSIVNRLLAEEHLLFAIPYTKCRRTELACRVQDMRGRQELS